MTRQIFIKPVNTLSIRTHQPIYSAGEMVRGDLIYTVVSATHIDAINMVINGHESTHFMIRKTRTISTGKGRVRTYTVTYPVNDRKTFFSGNIMKYDQKCTLYPGEYVFSFEFCLDSRLPGSIEITGDLTANIHYEIVAEVIIPGASAYRKTWFIKVVSIPTVPVSMAQFDREDDVSFCCCFPRGRVSFMAWFSSNSLHTGQVLNSRVNVDNRMSRVNFRKVSVKIVRHITARAGSHEYSRTETIGRIESDKVNVGEIVERLMPLTIPKNAYHTTMSDLFQCRYEIIVSLSVPFSKNIKGKLDFQILDGSSLSMAPIPSPSNNINTPPPTYSHALVDIVHNDEVEAKN